MEPGGTSCQSCGATCPATARFCPSCGRAQQQTCSGCGALLLPGAHFCADCGTAAALREPAQTAPEPVSERRLTSVLFADLVAFTTLSEERDPEQVRELLSGYFRRCREIVARYDGVVEKFIGDAVMAVWGVPTAHEDDAERAVRAADDLVRMVADLGLELGAPLALRAGVVTGEVAVTVGATAEGMVAGDAVNTASRVQSAAEPGQVWVDSATRGLTSYVVEYGDTGDHLLKGKREPVRLYAVRSIHSARPDGDAHLTPLVGRQRELAMLQELFTAVAEEERPRLAVVDGDAGVGKSRLVLEFQRWLDTRAATVRWHRGRCLSYGEGVAFWALAEMARTRLGLLEGDTGQVVVDRVDDWIARTVADPLESVELRGPLLALVGASVDGPFDRVDLFSAWTRFFELVGSGDPVVLVIDDAHHADDGLLDFVEHLLGTTRSAVLVVAMARSELLERRRGWGGRRCSVVPLEPLAPDAMAALVDALVRGVPVEAPASLRGLVLSRLDALPPAERRLVADASVLGLSFRLDGLAALGADPRTLESAVASLLRKELFAVDGDRFSGERGQLRFVHAVVRQVAYGVLSRRDRKARHLAAAAHLASQPDDSGELDGLIAEHVLDALESSFDDDTDVPALRLDVAGRSRSAGERARRLGASGQASRLLERAADLGDDAAGAGRSLILAAEAATDAGEEERASELARRAVDLLEGCGDDLGAAEAYVALARALTWAGRFVELLAQVQECLPRVEAAPGAENAAYLLLERLAVAYANLGPPEKLDEVNELLVERGLASDDPGLQASGWWARAAICERREDWTGAVSAYDRAVELSDLSTGPGRARRSVSLVSAAAATMELDLEQALVRMRDATEAARRSGLHNHEAFGITSTLEFLYTLGRLDEMMAELDQLASRPPSTNTFYLVAWLEAVAARATGRSLNRRKLERHADGGEALLMQHLAEMQWAFIDGRDGDVVDSLTGALDVAEEAGMIVIVWSFMPELVAAACRVQHDTLTRRLLDLAGAVDLDRASPMRRAYALLVLGSLSRHGAAEGWAQLLGSAVRALDALPAPGHAARARERLGRRLMGEGSSEEGAALLEDAAECYRRIGAWGWLAELEESSTRG